MKRYFRNTILVTASLLLLGSCNSFLDKMPDQRTETDTPEKIAAVLVSAYPQAMPILLHEKMSDNVVDNGTRYENGYLIIEEAYLFKNITDIGNSSPYKIWEECYTAITAANQALAGIASLPDPSVCDAQKGEALMCRAYAHFILANTFCMPYNDNTRDTELGLPYPKETEKKAVVEYERGTLGQLYDNILDDVMKGLPLIDDNLYSQPKYHFNRKAAHTFAAWVNLYMGNFDETIEFASVALGAAPEDLMRDMDIINSYNSSEDAKNQWSNSEEPANFMLAPLDSYAGRAISSPTCMRYNHSRNIARSETFWGKGGWGDKAPESYSSVYGQGAQSLFTAKVLEFFVYTDRDAGVGYTKIVHQAMTSDKALLLRAEAYVLKGMLEEATRDLQVYYRNINDGVTSATQSSIVSFYSDDNLKTTICKPLTPVSPYIVAAESPQEAMLQAVLHARRISTLSEGYRLQDLKRYGIPYSHNIGTVGSVNIEPWDSKLVIQIPEAVVSAGMQPNP